MNRIQKEELFIKRTVIGVVAAALGLFAIPFFIETVDAGHESAGTYFGKVLEEPLTEGIHFVNPLVSWAEYSLQEQAITFEEIAIPAADQQLATVDVTVQYRLQIGSTPSLRKEYGKGRRILDVALIPQVRSILREQGKTVKKVENFFNNDVQARIQLSALETLNSKLKGSGLVVSNVLFRKVELPPVIAEAIQSKKQREQEVEKQRAELERMALEQQEIVRQAEAERDAAKLQAQAVRIKAEAEAAANRLIAASLTPKLVELRRIERWTGEVPRFSSGGNGTIIPVLNLDTDK